jgi:hypothetical protein
MGQRARPLRRLPGELWTFGEEVARLPGAIGVAPVDPNLSYPLDYLYRTVPILQLPAGETDASKWLATHLPVGNAAGKQVLTPIWRTGAHLMADSRQSLPFYLQREGTLQAEEQLHVLTYLHSGWERVPSSRPRVNEQTSARPFRPAWC